MLLVKKMHNFDLELEAWERSACYPPEQNFLKFIGVQCSFCRSVFQKL